MEHKHHVWSFSKIGGIKRVSLESGNDLVHLESLDPKLWTALSCPVDGLEIDKKTLEIIDTDKDGHIRVPEMISAVNWITMVLKNPGDLLLQDPVFPLSAINSGIEEGKRLLESATDILRKSGKEGIQTLTVEDTSAMDALFSALPLNGDGIITADTTAEPGLTGLLEDVIKYSGSVMDRGGKQGISLDILETFAAQCQKYTDWYALKDTDPDTIYPLGAGTEDAYRNFCAVKQKIDDYFIRCRLAAFDPQATDMLNLQLASVEAITGKDLSGCLDEIAAYPLARVEAGRPLPLEAGINPAWESAITVLKTGVVNNLFPGNVAINETEWLKMVAYFSPYAKWQSEKEGAIVEPLGINRIREILTGGGLAKLTSLIEQDKTLADEADSIMMVDKLVRYYRDLFTLLKNFVTFYDFYNPGSKGIFQAGTLYIDQRSCDLCIKVSDMPKHATMASYSAMYLLYCDCTSRSTNAKMTIAAALTNGDVDNLMVGRNALFYDRSGLDWDATVVKIVDNPISIRQAFFSPYRKLSRLIDSQANKMAASQEAKVSADMSKNVDGAAAKPADAKTAQPPFDVGKFAGIFAAIGLAIGAIGTAAAAVLGGFMKLAWWKMPLAILGLLLLISTPSMIIAFLKLRKRNLAPILDANGWAINARVTVNIPFGNTLTHLAQLPPGAKINMNDPFTKKRRPILPMILGLLVLACIVLYLLKKYGIINF